MGGNFTRIYTRPTGGSISGPNDDTEFDNIIANCTPTGIDDYSANVAQMQSTVDPYPAGVESLATSTAGEHERTRYLLKQQHMTTQWYIFPDLVSKTTTYTATLNDRVILCDATGGAWSLTLPTAVGSTDKMFFIKKTDSSANAITIDGNGAETIDGAATVILPSQYDFCVIVSNGTNWHIIATSMPKEFNKGADIASATTLTLGADGNYFDVTGTTTITAIATRRVGAIIRLHFDGALTLTHHATDLVLPSGANITTAAGDEATFVEYASGDWRCVQYQKASGTAVVGGNVVQTVYTETGAVATGTTLMVLDDTIPQNTEGDEYMTRAITPTSASNVLEIRVVIFLANSSASCAEYLAALFQDATANALAAGFITKISGANTAGCIIFTHHMVAGTTSSTTFKVRAGCNTAGTTTFNGAAGGRYFGGVMASSITITERLP